MTKIPLTQGYFALVDDKDYAMLSQYKWYAHKDGSTFYAQRADCGKTAFMHREILGLQRNDGKITDHIDNDGLNNQRSNLRICTHQQNCRNRRKTKNTSSIYKGVFFFKRDNKWRTMIWVDNKGIFLGYFDTEIEAAEAYDKAAIELFGEFAKTNENLNENTSESSVST